MKRNPNYKINPLILNRRSLRAMSDEKLSEDEFMPLFEAARWAPSSFNNQHWRFVYAKKGTKHWDEFFDLLGEWNKGWCVNAAVLVIVVSKKTFDRNDKPARTHSFDTGAAWENMALEGTGRGLVVHAMEGFDYDKAAKLLELGKDYQVEAMVAIGKPERKKLTDEYAETDKIPTERRPLKEIVFEGRMKK